jgi:hypothetical protein
MSDESEYTAEVAEVLASDRRRTFLAFLAQEVSIAGRLNYSQAGDLDPDTRIGRFASLNEALHVLGAQLAADAGQGAGYPDTAFAASFLGKAMMYDRDAGTVRGCLTRALERSKTG